MTELETKIARVIGKSLINTGLLEDIGFLGDREALDFITQAVLTAIREAGIIMVPEVPKTEQLVAYIEIIDELTGTPWVHCFGPQAARDLHKAMLEKGEIK